METIKDKLHSRNGEKAVLVLIIIDILLSRIDDIKLEIQLVQTLYDTATPDIASTTGSAASVLSTNNSTWTIMRTTLFWLQVVLRVTFVAEVGLRIATKSLAKFLKSVIDVVDGAVCFLALILKFSLPARESLAFNLLILLRFIRISVLAHKTRAEIEAEYSQKTMLLERHCNEIIHNSEIQTKELGEKLKIAENKFKIMIGDFEV